MGLLDNIYGGGGTMSEDQKKYATTMGLLGLASQLLEGSSPSTDPSHGSFAGALGKGLQGGMAGMGAGVNQMQAAQYGNLAQQRAKETEQSNEMMAKIMSILARAESLGKEPTQTPSATGGLNVPPMLQQRQAPIAPPMQQTPQLPPNPQAMGLQGQMNPQLLMELLRKKQMGQI